MRAWPLALLALVGTGMGGPLDALVLRYREARTLRARFLQRTELRHWRRTEEAGGTFWFRWPCRFRWEYERPEHKVIVGDGRRVTLLLPGRAVVQPLNGTPLGMVFGNLSDLERVFRVEPERGGWLSLLPRRPLGNVERLRLRVEEGIIREMHIQDVYGNVTLLRFQQVQLGVPLEEGLFRPRIPPGTEVIRP